MSLLIALVLAALIQSPAPSGATLTGQVLEEGTGAAVAGAQVNVMRAPTERPAAGTMGVPVRPLSTTTDREGRFQVDGLEPGRYRISVQKAGFAMSLDAAPPIDLGAGERRGIDVRLQRGAVIVGRVLDEAGEPLAEARVMAMRKMPANPAGARTYPDLLRPAGPTAQTNDLGEFRLFSLPPGEYLRAGLTATRRRRRRRRGTAREDAAGHVLSFDVGPCRRGAHHPGSGSDLRAAGHHDGRRAGVSGVRRGGRRVR